MSSILTLFVAFIGGKFLFWNGDIVEFLVLYLYKF